MQRHGFILTITSLTICFQSFQVVLTSTFNIMQLLRRETQPDQGMCFDAWFYIICQQREGTLKTGMCRCKLALVLVVQSHVDKYLCHAKPIVYGFKNCKGIFMILYGCIQIT